MIETKFSPLEPNTSSHTNTSLIEGRAMHQSRDAAGHARYPILLDRFKLLQHGWAKGVKTVLCNAHLKLKKAHLITTEDHIDGIPSSPETN